MRFSVTSLQAYLASLRLRSQVVSQPESWQLKRPLSLSDITAVAWAGAAIASVEAVIAFTALAEVAAARATGIMAVITVIIVTTVPAIDLHLPLKAAQSWPI